MLNEDNKIRCLVVDDSLLSVKIATNAVSSISNHIDSCISGKDAIQMVKMHHYDVILMDIMMPEMDGVETFRRLKEIEGFNTPIVAVTSDNEKGAKEKYLEIGFNAYLDKPYRDDILIDIILKILA